MFSYCEQLYGLCYRSVLHGKCMLLHLPDRLLRKYWHWSLHYLRCQMHCLRNLLDKLLSLYHKRSLLILLDRLDLQLRRRSLLPIRQLPRTHYPHLHSLQHILPNLPIHPQQLHLLHPRSVLPLQHLLHRLSPRLLLICPSDKAMSRL